MFYLTHYIKNILISTCKQYLKIERFYIFSILSLQNPESYLGHNSI